MMVVVVHEDFVAIPPPIAAAVDRYHSVRQHKHGRLGSDKTEGNFASLAKPKRLVEIGYVCDKRHLS
jgi:hypothetical protein